MAEKYMTVTLRLKLVDLPDEDRENGALEIGDDESDPPGVQDLDGSEVSDAIASYISDECQSEMWAGSGMFANVSQADVISWAWDNPVAAEV